MGNKTDKELMREFSAYLKVAIMNEKKQYLQKLNKIRSNETLMYDVEYEAERADVLLEESNNILRITGKIDTKKLLDLIEDASLYNCVKRLKVEQKEILMLRIVYQMEFEEIGEVLDIAAKKAEYAYYNTIAKIRRSIGENHNDI